MFVDPWIKRSLRAAIRAKYCESGAGDTAVRLTKFNRIPENQHPRIGKLYIQRHEASHLHHDVSIVDSNGVEIFRGAVSKSDIGKLFPQGKIIRTSFARQPQHSRGRYGYNWSGVIKEGYGKGTQTVVFEEQIEIIKTHSKGEILFNIYKSDTNKDIMGRFALIDMKDDDKSWICSRRKYDEPQVKGKNEFKLLPTDTGRTAPDKAIALQEKLRNEGKAFTVETKIDGAANLIELNESGNKIWSWREGKKEPTIYLQDKFPNIRDDIHPEFHKTVARGELIYVPKPHLTHGAVFQEYGKEHPNFIAKFSLIQNPLRSRYEQQTARGTTAIVIYDLAKYQGKSTKNLTYREKYKIMEKIAKRHDAIYVPKQFKSVEEGWKETVVKKGGEGLIIKLLDEVTPDPQFNPDAQAWWKVKHSDCYDCKITDWKPLVRKSGKIDKSQMGVLVCKVEGLGTTEVGTGFTEFQRKWFAEHAKEVIKDDSVIRVKAHHVTDSGSLHGPVYKGVHEGKSEGAILELKLYESADAMDTSPYALKSRNL